MHNYIEIMSTSQCLSRCCSLSLVLPLLWILLLITPLTCAEIRTSTVEISDEMRGRSIQKAKVRTTWIPSQFLMRWTNMLFLLICSLSYGILHCVEKYWPWTLSADWDIAGKDRQLWWADGGQHWRGICRRWRRAVLEISTLQFFLTLFFSPFVYFAGSV